MAPSPQRGPAVGVAGRAALTEMITSAGTAHRLVLWEGASPSPRPVWHFRVEAVPMRSPALSEALSGHVPES